MIAMIFECRLDPAHVEDYVPVAVRIRQLVNEIDGFISFERFTSASDPDKLLGLGFFRDEAAVREWRNLPEHRRAQVLGRETFFSEYRLRMAEVVRDYGSNAREQVPDDSRAVHDTPQGENQHV